MNALRSITLTGAEKTGRGRALGKRAASLPHRSIAAKRVSHSLFPSAPLSFPFNMDIQLMWARLGRPGSPWIMAHHPPSYGSAKREEDREEERRGEERRKQAEDIWERKVGGIERKWGWGKSQEKKGEDKKQGEDEKGKESKGERRRMKWKGKQSKGEKERKRGMIKGNKANEERRGEQETRNYEMIWVEKKNERREDNN